MSTLLIPQMILFCRDPQGETITTATPVQSALASVTATPNQTQVSKNKEWEVKISALERTVNDKDKTIMELLERIQGLTQKVQLAIYRVQFL